MYDETADASVGSTDDLGHLLRRYADRVLELDAMPETVSITVDRVDDFRNHVTAASGHEWLVDEPRSFGGTGAAADPAELLLAAAAASFSVTLTAHAALRGIAVQGLSVRSTGEMDARAFFFPGEGRPGLTSHYITVRVRSVAGRDAVAQLVEDAAKASPIIQALVLVPQITVEHRGEDAG